jgi:hypothetical protein
VGERERERQKESDLSGMIIAYMRRIKFRGWRGRSSTEIHRKVFISFFENPALGVLVLGGRKL